jgi:two-component system CheB/CheR fusion protein
MSIVRNAARDLTGADGATFVLRDGDFCYYAEENAISPLWKGQRFPIETCISGWAMLNAEPAVIEDIYQDSRIPHAIYKPTFVKSLVMVPIRKEDPIGAIGNYWAKKHVPTAEEVSILQALADTTSVALRNSELYGELQNQIQILKQNEKQINDQKEALEIFSRALAHDLKEPMRTINSYSELIGETATLSKQDKAHFKLIQYASERMITLINSVLGYTQLDNISEARKVLCDTNTIVHSVIQSLKQLIEETEAVVTYDNLPEIKAIPAQLFQLFENLICNAIHHNSNKPEISIKASRTKDGWCFSVQDNGDGIEDQYNDKVFEPFKRLTNDDNRTGLGLAVCSKIVQYHHGMIWHKPNNGEGTTFYFVIPTNQENIKPKQEEPKKALNTAQQHGLANILVVDDRDSDLVLTKLLLTNKLGVDCNLFDATNAEDAVNFLNSPDRDKAPIQLILLDINMPKIDGFELLSHLKNNPKFCNIPVAMCTGSTYEKDFSRAREMGAVGYIVKPIQFDEFADVISKTQLLQLNKNGDRYLLQYAA